MSEPTTTAELIAVVASLAGKVDQLVEGTQRVADELAEQRTRVGALGKRGTLLSLIIGTAVVLLAGGGLLFGSQAITRAEVERLAAEARRHDAEVWCPFLGVIVGSYRPESRPEGEARRIYEEQFSIMFDIFENRLRCTGPVVPRAGG